jgi:hypothetical protein
VRTGHDVTAALGRKVQRRLARMLAPGVTCAGAFCTQGAARLSEQGVPLRDRTFDESSSSEDLHLGDLPPDVRHLVVSTVRTLAKRGVRALVEEGLCPADAEEMLTRNRNDYPGSLIAPPDSAEIRLWTNRDGNLEIELPLHDEQVGQMDLVLFLEINPSAQSVKVTDLYTP